MKIRSLLAMLLLGFSLDSPALVLQWTNTAGGSWQAAANWSPNTIPSSTDDVYITNAGAYTVVLSNGTATAASLRLGQTLLIDNAATLNVSNASVIAGGTLVATNAWMAGALTIQAGAQMWFTGSATKFIYGLNFANLGTVNWNGGTIAIGGNPATTINNAGLWTVASNDTLYNGGGNVTAPIWNNTGILRKSGGTGASSVGGMNFFNQPGGLVEALTGTLALAGGASNVIAGSFSATAPGTLSLNTGTWYDAGGMASGTGTNQLTFQAVMNLRTNPVPGLKLLGGDVYIIGTNTFQQAGTITNLTLDGATLHGSNKVDNGFLAINGGSFPEQIFVLPSGQLVFGGATSKLLYGARIFNQGTVTFAAGSINVGGTTISNGGLWQIAGDLGMGFGGGQTPTWNNAGILRKTTGSGAGGVDGFSFTNQPGALVEALSGTLRFTGGAASQLGGTFNAVLPAMVEIGSGTWTDAGGVATGTGTNRFNGGTFNLRTNTIPGLKLTGGELYITGTNTFQQAGAITNLTLDGAVLRGTNVVGAGALTNNNSGMVDRLTVSPAGTLVLAGASKNLYSAQIFNQGTVLWTGGSMNVGSTPPTIISNGGLWQVTGDFVMSYGGGLTPVWTNSGTLWKSAGPGTSSISGLNFYNRTSGLVQVDTGTLQLTSATTNLTGTLRLNGGTLAGSSGLMMAGGTLDGAGSVGANSLLGGTISPGLGGAGLMIFKSGLNLGSNAVLSLDGTGTAPGLYDQLTVTGAVVLGNCTLQVTSLPSVSPGTTLTIIANDGTDPVGGTFNGLAENQLFNVGPQMFRIHYADGTGNDVTLVRAPGPMSLTPREGFTNGGWFFSGEGTPAGLVYTIQATTNLIDWANIGVVTGDGGGRINFIDTNAAHFNHRFYRTTN